MAPSLLPEIISNIVAYNQDDPETLRNISLLSRVWRDAAQHFLFQDFVVRLCNSSDIIKWKECSAESPHILRFVRTIVIDSGMKLKRSVWIGSNEYYYVSALMVHFGDMDELPMMPNVRLLEWAPRHIWYYDMVSAVTTLFTKFPALEGISLNSKFLNVAQVKTFLNYGGRFNHLEFGRNFTLDANGLLPHEKRQFEASAANAVCDFRGLDELVISRNANETTVNSFDWLVNDVFGENCPELKSIEVQGSYLSIGAVARLMRACLGTLRHLTIRPSSIRALGRIRSKSSSPFQYDRLSLQTLAIGPIELNVRGVLSLNCVLLFLPKISRLHTIHLYIVTELDYLLSVLTGQPIPGDDTELEEQVESGEPIVSSYLRLTFSLRNAAERDLDRTGALETAIRDLAPWERIEIFWEYPDEKPPVPLINAVRNLGFL